MTIDEAVVLVDTRTICGHKKIGLVVRTLVIDITNTVLPGRMLHAEDIINDNIHVIIALMVVVDVITTIVTTTRTTPMMTTIVTTMTIAHVVAELVATIHTIMAMMTHSMASMTAITTNASTHD